ncbi:MAG TPA: aminotransferase class V-fold PLP-dependent enzyme [Edaphocola sp.]|nr:aminotransferase class V-fold PLP-dependent enzyme [Edaphocola sp.]
MMDYPEQKGLTYLNTAACGLVSGEIAAPGIAFYRDLSKGSATAEFWRDQLSVKIRGNIARFLNAPERNIAMIPCFSHGMNALVQSLKGSENILLYEWDYPSLINPFKVNNFNISWLRSEDGFSINPQSVAEKIKNEDIDIVALSHVQWMSGAIADLKAIIDICHRQDVLFIVDTTQSLGAEPVNIGELEPDALISSNYKWMNAGFGTGIMYLSDRFLGQYPPVYGGVNSYIFKEGQETRRPSILDYEPGHLNMAGFSVLDAAINHKLEVGVENIARHNRQLTELFVKRCPELPVTLVGRADMQNRSAIVVLKDEAGLGPWLLKNNFIVTLRNNTIRLSFHEHNTEEEVLKLINCIQTTKV